MPNGGSLFGWLVSLSLYSVYVQELRSLHVLQVSQYAHQFRDVVAVDGTEVAYVHALKDVGL